MARTGSPVTLVLGGARSGKSAHAEALAEASGLERIYVATAEALDGEMAARIRHHQDRRGAGWRTIEEPLALPALVRGETAPERILLVDCLTLWLTNLLLAGRNIEAERRALLAALGSCRGPVILVSNEVGQGIVPIEPLSRRFVDESGRLHQEVAALAAEVVLMVAGLPLRLKSATA